MSKPTLTIDPNPCHEYPWLGDCPECYSHAHYCELGGGHAGACRCGNCGTTAGPYKAEPDAAALVEARLLQAANNLAAALGEDAPDTAELRAGDLVEVVAGLAARVRGGGR